MIIIKYNILYYKTSLFYLNKLSEVDINLNILINKTMDSIKTNKQIFGEALVQLLCGALGGAISSYISYPMVVVRLNKVIQ